MDSKQTSCVGSRDKCNTINLTEYEKVILKTQKFVKVSKGKCDICGRFKSKLFT